MRSPTPVPNASQGVADGVQSQDRVLERPFCSRREFLRQRESADRIAGARPNLAAEMSNRELSAAKFPSTRRVVGQDDRRSLRAGLRPVRWFVDHDRRVRILRLPIQLKLRRPEQSERLQGADADAVAFNTPTVVHR